MGVGAEAAGVSAAGAGVDAGGAGAVAGLGASWPRAQPVTIASAHATQNDRVARGGSTADHGSSADAPGTAARALALAAGPREVLRCAAHVEHATIEAAGLPAREAYQLMIDLVAPRPIAWVSTCDDEGRRNLAPFSYYQGVCSQPPMIVLSIAWRDGRPKDTLRNILATGELVVNHVDREHAAAMNATSADEPPEVDEWAEVIAAGLGPLTPVPARMVRPCLVGEAKAALECRLVHAIPLGHARHGGPSSTLVVAEVVAFRLAPALVVRDESGRLRPIDPAQLASVGRMGQIAYTDTTAVFSMPRPRPRKPA